MIKNNKDKLGGIILEGFNAKKPVKKAKKPFLIVLMIILCVFSTILTYKAIRTPIELEQKIVKHTIEEKITFDYFVMVKPSTLYPEGGIVTPDKAIFTTLTDRLLLKLNAEISSEKPVKFEGQTGAVYSIIAKGMWERKYELIPIKDIESEGTLHNIFQQEIQFDIPKIMEFLDRVGEETKTRTASNLIVVKPIIQGFIYDINGEKIFEVANTIEIPFEVSGQVITYAAEPPEKEFTNTQSIEDTNTIPQSFNIFGREMPVVSARYTFGIISAILLLSLICMFVIGMKNKAKNTSEINTIDKKHKNKIVSVSDRFGFDNMPQLRLDSFKALLQIADEKDEPILRYEDASIVYYYIVGNATIYYYHVLKSIIVEGSGITHDA